MKLLVKNATERKILKLFSLKTSLKLNLKIYQVSIMIYSNLTNFIISKFFRSRFCFQENKFKFNFLESVL